MVPCPEQGYKRYRTIWYCSFQEILKVFLPLWRFVAYIHYYLSIEALYSFAYRVKLFILFYCTKNISYSILTSVFFCGSEYIIETFSIFYFFACLTFRYEKYLTIICSPSQMILSCFSALFYNFLALTVLSSIF